MKQKTVMSTVAGGRDWTADGAGWGGEWVRLLSVVARLQFRLSEVQLGALVSHLSVGWFGSFLRVRLVWRLDPLVMTSRVPSPSCTALFMGLLPSPRQAGWVTRSFNRILLVPLRWSCSSPVSCRRNIPSVSPSTILPLYGR